MLISHLATALLQLLPELGPQQPEDSRHLRWGSLGRAVTIVMIVMLVQNIGIKKVLTILTFKGLNSMGELFEEFVSIKRSFLVEWSFILVIPNRFAKNPPEVFLSLATLISTCSPIMMMMMMMTLKIIMMMM